MAVKSWGVVELCSLRGPVTWKVLAVSKIVRLRGGLTASVLLVAPSVFAQALTTMCCYKCLQTWIPSFPHGKAFIRIPNQVLKYHYEKNIWRNQPSANSSPSYRDSTWRRECRQHININCTPQDCTPQVWTTTRYHALRTS